jgi:hypothetical protein
MKTMRVAGFGVFCVALVIVSACAARTQTSPASRASSRDRIAASELSDIPAINAYDAVHQLRPQWLRSRGVSSLRESQVQLPAVYVDNMRFGDLAALQNIPIAEISEIIYISGPDATTRWGTGVSGGVIQVIRKKG